MIYSLLIILIFAFFVASYYALPQLIVNTGNKASRALRLQAKFKSPADFNLKYRTHDIAGADGVLLKAWFVECPDTAKGVIIFLHGIRAYKEHFIEMSAQVAQWGYHSVLIDNRAHGESEGNYCTFGYYEKTDVKHLVDSVKKHYPKLQVGLWGQSLGAAIALESMSINTGIDFGIIESTYPTFRIITNDYIKRLIPFLPEFYRNYLINRAGKIANFDPDEVKPIESVKKIHRPILYAHGSIDKRIKPEYGNAIYKNIACTHKELYIVEGANHVNVWQIGGKQYLEKVKSFLKKQY